MKVDQLSRLRPHYEIPVTSVIGVQVNKPDSSECTDESGDIGFRDEDVEVRVAARLLTRQGVHTPSAVQLYIQPRFIEEVQELVEIVECDFLMPHEFSRLRPLPLRLSRIPRICR